MNPKVDLQDRLQSMGKKVVTVYGDGKCMLYSAYAALLYDAKQEFTFDCFLLLLLRGIEREFQKEVALRVDPSLGAAGAILQFMNLVVSGHFNCKLCDSLFQIIANVFKVIIPIY